MSNIKELKESGLLALQPLQPLPGILNLSHPRVSVLLEGEEFSIKP